MKARNRLLALVTAGMIFLGGKGIANADEKKANLQEKVQSYTQGISNTDNVEEWNEMNEYGSDNSYDVIKDTTTCKSKEKKAKPYIDPYKKTNDKWKKWLPQFSVQAEVQPSHIIQNEKVTATEDFYSWTYEREAERKYNGLKTNINGAIKQPTPLVDLNFKIGYISNNGNFEKNAINGDPGIQNYIGTYKNTLLKIKAFLSKELKLNNKTSITPKFGLQVYDDKQTRNFDYQGTDVLFPINAEREESGSTGRLVGLEAKTKIGKLDGKLSMEYTDETSPYKFVYTYPDSTAVPGGWDKGINSGLAKSTSKLEASLGNDSFLAKLFCNLKKRHPRNSEWDFNCTKYTWDPAYMDLYDNQLELGFDVEKNLNKYITANIGINGTLPLAVSNPADAEQRTYSNQENLTINAGIKARFDFSKVDYNKLFKGKQKK